ncbi:MAG: alpha/beta fold hydrolase [Solirubrobacterales bacterium]
MRAIPTPEEVAAGLANTYDAFVGGGLADTSPQRSSIIDEGPHRAVHRYWERPDAVRSPHGAPVLLVPPLAAPAFCFDLRRGCSMVEYLLEAGRRVYLVDYGAISFNDRNLGIEDWLEEIIPSSVEAVHRDAGREDVQLVGWCMGGIFSLLAAAGGGLPVRSVSMVASPVDFTQVPLVAPIRPLVDFTGGRILTALYRTMGGAPRSLVKRAYQLAAFDKYVIKPLAVMRNIDDRDFLAQIEAVDRFTDNMLAYPGRTFGQLYHRFFRTNDLANGEIEIGGRPIRLADVRQPVLSIAGEGDGIAPMPAVHHVGSLLPNAEELMLEKAPGGHLGVLTGRGARRTTWPILEGWLAEHDPRDRGEPQQPLVPQPLQAA